MAPPIDLEPPIKYRVKTKCTLHKLCIARRDEIFVVLYPTSSYHYAVYLITGLSFSTIMTLVARCLLAVNLWLNTVVKYSQE